MSHALVIGGTGMLRNATLWLATRFEVVSVVARSEERLRMLSNDAGVAGGIVNPMSLDYRDDALLRSELVRAIERFGEIELALSWIHSNAPNAHREIAAILNTQRVNCRWFDVLGSASADPSRKGESRREEFAQWGRLSYRSITLGFIASGSHSRWLTDDEIANGTIEAIDKDIESSVIGQVHPWSLRP